MHHLLQSLLRKKGIKDVSDLESYEVQDFERWGRILSEGEITVDKIKEFCKNQIHIIEGKFKDLDNTKEKNEKLIIMFTVYRSLIELIEAPSIEKENLEKYITSLIK